MGKLHSFVYDKGFEKTNRIGFVLTKPSTVYGVLEVVDGDEDIENIEKAVRAEEVRHKLAMEEISQVYGLQYKSFTASKVSNLMELE